MKQHGVDTGHSVVLSFADISAWCYKCDAYVHNPVSCLYMSDVVSWWSGCSVQSESVWHKICTAYFQFLL